MDAGFGHIDSWNEARGFGFLVPEQPQRDVPVRLFFHARDYDRRGTQPAVGARVRFTPQRQPDGRWRAIRVAGIQAAAQRPAAHRAPRRRTQGPETARGIGGLWIAMATWLMLLGIGASNGQLPPIAVAALAGLNLLTFGAYAFDKRAAQRGRWRTPESQLHLLELLGGWPAAAFAQQLLRHKRSKTTYRRRYFAMVALHLLALVAWTFA